MHMRLFGLRSVVGAKVRGSIYIFSHSDLFTTLQNAIGI